MVNELSSQVIQKTIEATEKLLDLSTRLDERVKTLQINESDVWKDIYELQDQVSTIEKDLSNQSNNDDSFAHQIKQTHLALIEIDKKLSNTLYEFDKRLLNLEMVVRGNESRWGQISNFIIQLVWVLAAAWALSSLGLESPP